MNIALRPALVWAAFVLVVGAAPMVASAQMGPSGPPAVGVAPAALRPVAQKEQITGRVEAAERVEIVARVSGFLEQRLFTEGAEVKAGQLLYRLERGTYEAAVEAAHAAIDQAKAQLENAGITLARSQKLLEGPAGMQSSVDTARANKLTAAGQLRAAEAQLRQAEINLDYTEIRSPIDGRIGRAATKVGNLVGPTSGPLTTIVSQDPMYVVFPVATRRVMTLRSKLIKDGFAAIKVRLRLPDGRLYDRDGEVTFIDINVAQDTDTILLRATIPNPPLGEQKDGKFPRELINGALVTVLLEDAEPVQVVAVPRQAVLSDQRGSYAYVIDAGNVARRRNLQLGPSTPEWASVEQGLSAGEQVVVEGVQRVRADTPVKPDPVSSGDAGAHQTPG
ncbi:Efflux pump periplasmic linker BepF [Rhodopseudomonas palustris]|uniref:Efflux RND transporter periplasmic adaptor subunit n=1 Tax=Rhodopseudomonas palustris (strain ATCC BAA-98 / CGA009) TaxID=258594 RepID=Q6N2F4_RHOPA|nr:efflux RND transporter periplasmic adaptor subunit [Rhodopseudomonas palustris]OPF92498.1 efflux transporter periplasmic adaptor subunit [Rhodopseudomonas palustris]QQM05657.1 Efflux pump periplasmic linker BepF [Rhodopseudomonas palustris]WAB76986.1 efflux RND transporter periplasmic adaptor subunit [Rhodopseudomonas palustris]WCL94281.1 efflux RND transporter periplasmic adaptor subunit [Rhodopseudomonas palustris CGA009]WND50898.1 efflux RND transporter periplasmic adaptor subunit [Rhodo